MTPTRPRLGPWLLPFALVGFVPLLGSCDEASREGPASAGERGHVNQASREGPAPEQDAPKQAAYVLATALEQEPAKLAPSKGGIASAKTCGPAGVTTPPDACPTTRMIAHFTNGEKTCPSPGAGWTVEQLFVGAKTPMNLYCRYVWTGAGSPTSLPKSVALVSKPDCRVFPQSPMAGALGPAYDSTFSQGAQPVGGTSLLPGGQAVRIAVVDTAPRQTSMGQSAHGPSLAAIVGKLASGCVAGLGEASCRRSVMTELGLPQTRSGPDESKGGYFGYQSELAEGIVEVLNAWPDQNAGDQLLVLNLAVGWEPKPDDFSNPSPAVEAVRDALAIAQCRGALIVAASGNKPAGTCMAQATGPGAWASEPGMTVAQCQGLGLALADIELPNPLHAYHPFLHAATPVDWSQANLADFRTGSNAKLAALGFAGYDTVGNQAYGPMTGSSISTAVIAGTAALVWSYFPTLSADAVMQLLYDSGRGTGRTADIGLSTGGQAQVQRQVGACSALRYACNNWQSYASGQPSVCSNANVVACPSTGPGAVSGSAWSSSFDQVFAALPPGDVGSANGPTWTLLECNGCNGAPKRVALPPSLTTEPDRHAWVLPQPQKAPCPICKIKTDTLYLSTDPDYDSFTLIDMSVTLTDANGVTKVLYYPMTTLPTLSSRTVEAITDSQLLTVSAVGSPPIRAYVDMVFDAGGIAISAGNQIPID